MSKLFSNVAVFAWFICGLSLFSCSRGEQDAQAVTIDNVRLSEPPPVQEESMAVPDSKSATNKLIRNANYTFEVADLIQFDKDLKVLNQKWNARVMGETSFSLDDRISSNYDLNIPAAQFDKYLAELEKLAFNIDNKNIHAEDITAQYVDVAARLKTKQELEKRYLALLSSAKKVDEILNIERELAAVRADLESMQGQMKLWDSQVSYSKLSLEAYQRQSSGRSFFSQIAPAIKSGWKGLQWMLLLVLRLWPLYLLGAIIWIYRRLR